MEINPWLAAAVAVYVSVGIAFGVWCLVRKWYIVKYDSKGVILTAALMALAVFLVAALLWLPIVLEWIWKNARHG
jgi:hypothetical protein